MVGAELGIPHAFGPEARRIYLLGALFVGGFPFRALYEQHIIWFRSNIEDRSTYTVMYTLLRKQNIFQTDSVHIFNYHDFVFIEETFACNVTKRDRAFEN